MGPLPRVSAVLKGSLYLPFNAETFPNESSKGHMEVCVRFGRFPKRNAALGRESTPEEIEYMASEEAQGRPY